MLSTGKEGSKNIDGDARFDCAATMSCTEKNRNQWATGHTTNAQTVHRTCTGDLIELNLIELNTTSCTGMVRPNPSTEPKSSKKLQSAPVVYNPANASTLQARQCYVPFLSLHERHDLSNQCAVWMLQPKILFQSESDWILNVPVHHFQKKCWDQHFFAVDSSMMRRAVVLQDDAPL
jgi:hypothetical protein